MKTGSNKDINNDHKKLPPPDAPKILIPAARHDPVEATKLHNLKMLTEKPNDEKLAIILFIVAAGLIAYHFSKLLFQVGGTVVNALAFSNTNFIFRRLTDHGEEERKRHGLALARLQEARDEWNKDQMKWFYFMNKRPRERKMRQRHTSTM